MTYTSCRVYCARLLMMDRDTVRNIYRLASSQQNLYDIYQLPCVQCQTLDDGQRYCPKHIQASKQSPKPVWHIPIAVCTVLDSWWWTEELSETRTIYPKNKFEKLVRHICFIIRSTSNFQHYLTKGLQWHFYLSAQSLDRLWWNSLCYVCLNMPVAGIVWESGGIEVQFNESCSVQSWKYRTGKYFWQIVLYLIHFVIY